MNKGFSLLELSIVLVIIGLIAGGIVAGSSMIRAAEIRQLITTVDRYKTSTLVFRDKYFALPGDMKNATQFWTSATDGSTNQCTNPATDEGAGKQTCNGDGDNNIPVSDTTAQTYERYRFWQHLANAELIAADVSGVPDPAKSALDLGNRLTAGLNTPDVLGASVHPETLSCSGACGTMYPENGGLTLRYTTLLTAKEAWNVDKKLDDGRPGLGFIKNQHDNNTNCTTSTDETVAEWALDTDVNICTLNVGTNF